MQLSSRWSKIGVGMLLLAVAGAAGLWLSQDRLRAWYYVRGLSQATDKNRDAWIERVVSLDLTALPALLDRLRERDPEVCANIQAALIRLGHAWQTDENKAVASLKQMAVAFPDLSSAGQVTVLRAAQDGLPTEPRGLPSADPTLGAAGQLLTEAARTKRSEVHAAGLKLVPTVLKSWGLGELSTMTTYPHANPGEGPKMVLTACQELVQSCLKDDDSTNRMQAIRLAIEPCLNLRDQVVPLLADADPEVRRTVMLVVGATPEAIGTDELLGWLHDPDEDVRRLCETALRGRGLQDSHLRLGRALTDALPGKRLQVLDLLRAAPDLEPGTWIRRLSHDQAPAVRAAAVRAATEQPNMDLADRMQQMAQDDPSATVRQLAQFYLAARKPNRR